MAQAAEQHMDRVETRYGPVVVPRTGEDMISRFLLRYGEWAFNEARFIARNIPDGASILDIGAFLGTFGLGVALERRIRQICFVEANPVVTPLLRANVEANCRVPAIVVEATVTSATEAPPTGHYMPGNLSSFSFVRSAGSGRRSELDAGPDVISLRQLIAEHGVFDLIKIDAEGMELDIIESDPSVLTHPDTALWLECNEDICSLELARALLSKEYCVFYFAFPSFSPDNFLGSSDPIFPFAFEAGLLGTRDRTPTLDDRLRANGCMLVRIETEEDLRRAMWMTPRWGPRDWVDRPLEQVVALATRAVRGESYDSFLRAGSDCVGEGGSASELHLIRVNRLEQSLAKARQEVHAQRAAAATAAAKLAEAQQLATARAEDVRGLVAQLAQLQQASLAETDQTRAERDAALERAIGQIVLELRAISQLSAALERTTALAAGRQVLLDGSRASLSEAERNLEAARAQAEDLAVRLACAEADLAREIAARDAAERLVARVRRNPVWRAARPMRLMLHRALRRNRRGKNPDAPIL